jgi:pectin methylesterase-like acyl-CoA thioesterase
MTHIRRESSVCLIYLLALLLGSVLVSASSSAAATRTVGPGGPPTYDYATIQAAIDAAATSGDTVQVATGVYRENLIWNAKSIQLIGAGAGLSVINGDSNGDGTADGSCLRMSGVPTSASVQGFTFTKGRSPDYDTYTGPLGGGLFCDNSSPTITRNLFTGNDAGYGPAIAVWVGSSPHISDNVITANTIYVRAGAIYCAGAGTAPNISGNLIWGNQGGITFFKASGTVAGNTITGNSSFNITCDESSLTILNNIITFSTGSGIRVEDGSPPSVAYCDVYGNTGGNYVGLTGMTGINGNITEDPAFADAVGGNFHLKSRGGYWTGTIWTYDTVHSPCIDAGDRSSPFANELMPNGGRVNMGAYGNTAEASRSWFPNKVTVDDDFTPSTLGWGYFCFARVQDGIDAVTDGGTVNVAAGVYHENLIWNTNSIQLLGAGAGLSIINGDVDGDGVGDGSCVRMTDVPSTARLQGFTFTGGKLELTGTASAASGGGIFCYNSSPSIIACTITGNVAWYGGGICLYSSSPSLQANTITLNSALASGGGFFCYQGSP